MFNGQQTDQRQNLQPPSPSLPFATSSTGNQSSGGSPNGQPNGPGGNLDGVNQNIKLCVQATNNFAKVLAAVFSNADIGV